MEASWDEAKAEAEAAWVIESRDLLAPACAIACICTPDDIQLGVLTVTIDRDLDLPVYAQVADRLRQLIAAGELEPGASLPSVRRLAVDLGVNLNTIARAYRVLEGEGFLEIRNRAGVRVAAPAEEVEDSTHVRLVEQLRVALARLRQAGMTQGELSELVQREVLALGGDRVTESGHG